MLRRLGTSLANHRASFSTEIGSLWDLFKIDRDRRRSAPASYEPIQPDNKSPVRLARDLLQVVQETVFSRKFDELPKKCPLVKEESGLTSSDDEDSDRRIANLIDFFFTIVRSQKTDRKSSGGSCFKSEPSPTEEKIAPYTPVRVNTELEKKMETLIEFLASTGCIENEVKKEDKKITLMEFLFGPEDRAKPLIEINVQSDISKGLSLSESNINVKGLRYIDETPVDEGNETLVELLIKYMDDYSPKDRKDSKSTSLTPSLSEKSKSDVTINKLDNFSDYSKTKSDSTLTHTQDTVIDRFEQSSDKSRRISEIVVDLSHVKQDLEDILDVAVAKVYEIYNIRIVDDTMSDQEDVENFNAYTKPQFAQYLPYSVELSDIIEEDEYSSQDFDKMSEREKYDYAKRLAEELLHFIENKIQPCDSDSDSDEFNYTIKRSSISLIDLRNIPDLPPSMIIKPKVIRIDKSTSTNDISETSSDWSKRIDSACNTEDTTVTASSEQRALDKLESLTKFFSKSRLEIIDESLEDLAKSPKEKTHSVSKVDSDLKQGQASLDDVEDIQDEYCMNENDKNVNLTFNFDVDKDDIDGHSVTSLPAEWVADDD